MASVTGRHNIGNTCERVRRASIFGLGGIVEINGPRFRIEGGFDVTLANNFGNLEFTAYEKKITELLLTRTRNSPGSTTHFISRS